MLFSKSLIGLDIGTSSIKAVGLKPSGKGYALVHFGIEPLPPQTIVDGAIMNTAGVVDTIRKLITTQKISTKNVAVGISGHSVIIKKINMPQMTRQELDESIQWEAEQYIPFDIKEVNLDTQILRAESAIRGQMDVMLVAAKKEMVNEYAAVVQEAGLLPSVIDVDAFALQNQYEANYQISQGETVALLNIGASVINVNILSDGITSFTRDITMGGNLLTEEVQRQLNVSYEEAEALKIGSAYGEDEDAVVPQEVERVLTQVSAQMAAEVQRSIDFYAATTADNPIGKVMLSGGASKSPALQRALSAQLNMPIELSNPFRNIQIDERKFSRDFLTDVAPMAAISVGLALRRPGDHV
jgi:type IV pilus assembly protein PilM